MAKEPLVASTTKTAQPDVASTLKDQKAFQIPASYDENAARVINQELDRLHSRINGILVAAAALADLDTATATTAQIATRVNELAAIMRDSGLLNRT